MQLPSLVSEAEAETVICFCFRTAPDSELPAVKPEWGSTDFCAGVEVWGVNGVLTHHVGAHTHRQPTMDTRVTHR